MVGKWRILEPKIMTPRIVIQIRVTRAEKRTIQRAAKRAGMSVSEWMRMMSRWSS